MKKRLVKELAKVAAEMPVIFRQSVEKHFVKGSELLEQGITDLPNPRANEFGQPERVPVIAGMTYVQPMPVQIAINHKRKLKNVLKSYGISGVHSYVDAVIKHQAQKEIEEKK